MIRKFLKVEIRMPPPNRYFRYFSNVIRTSKGPTGSCAATSYFSSYRSQTSYLGPLSNPRSPQFQYPSPDSTVPLNTLKLIHSGTRFKIAFSQINSKANSFAGENVLVIHSRHETHFIF